MKYLYNAIYLLLLIIVSPWIIWRVVARGKNRNGWKEKLFGIVPRRKNGGPCIWIHAVSVGEVNLLPKLVSSFKEQYPNVEVAISSTTDTGLKLAQTKFPDDHVFYCPSDFSWAIHNVLNRISPNMLVLTELEIWPNLISLTADQDIPVVLINGRISEKSYRGYQCIRLLMSRIVKRISFACVQTNDYRDRLISLQMPQKKISVTGNVKFDNALSAPVNNHLTQSLKQIANFSNDDFVFLAGSTLEIEDLMMIAILDELQEQFPQLRLVLVPRHPHRVNRIENEIQKRGLSYSLRSSLSDSSVCSPTDRILVVDVIGELAHWWQIADAGFVGGSMGRRGGQNMIEPSACGVPIAFGPDTENFKDVVSLLLARDGAQVVRDRHELQRFVVWAISRQNDAAQMGKRAYETVVDQQGALDRTLAILGRAMDMEKRHNLDSRNAA